MGVRTFRGEGNAASKLVGLIREIGDKPDLLFRLGTVIQAPPTLRIEVDGSGLILEAGDVTFAEDLLEHTRTITLSGSSPTVAAFSGKLSAGDRVIMFAYQTEYGPEYVVIDKAVRI